MNTHLETIQNNIQDLTMETLKHWNRNFNEMNLFPFSQSKSDTTTHDESENKLSKKRVSYHVNELRQKRPMDNIETLYLTSIGLFGIYLFYKLVEKTNMIP
jgi:hypothetical protein